MNLLLNLIWLLFGGFIVVFAYVLGAVMLAITIIGLPLAAQHLKMTRLALIPFGFEVREIR